MSDPIRSISQNNFILADQKEVAHDNTLSGNGTEESPLGVNETVLFDNGTTTSATCSEAPSNFERIRIFYNRGDDSFIQEYPGSPKENIIQIFCAGAFTNGFVSFYTFRYTVSGSTISPTSYLKETFGNSTLSIRNANAPTIVKIVGINRIANN